MAKPTKQRIKLLEAKREELRSAHDAASTTLDRVSRSNREYVLLTSVADSLCSELDKLTKKEPSEELTHLAVEQLNQVIADVKHLIPDDPYIARTKEFVPAGDNPANRDALLVLGQVRAGLARNKPEIDRPLELSGVKKSEVNKLIELFSFVIDGGSDEQDEMPRNFQYGMEKWFDDVGGYEDILDYDLISRTNFTELFNVE
ncbi:MAG: hypothetical protein ACYC96_15545 [Fimbriimonadaceae bacterium]